MVTKEKYAVFASAIKTFKSSNNFEKLVTVFPTVFNNTPQQQALMKSMSTTIVQRSRFKVSYHVTFVFLHLVADII